MTEGIFCSLINEIAFLSNLLYWRIEWRNLVRFLMKESVFVTPILYTLYWILLGLLGILLGFLLGLGIYGRKDEIDDRFVFFLLLLLNILYNKGFCDILLEPLRIRSLESRNIEEFSKFSLQVCELNNSRPSKLFLGESVEKPQIPFPLLGYPSTSIDIDFLFEKPTNYEFELFRLYRNGSQKVKS